MFYYKHLQPFSTEAHLLTTMTKKAFKNILGKGGHAGNQHFLLFLQCFTEAQLLMTLTKKVTEKILENEEMLVLTRTSFMFQLYLTKCLRNVSLSF